MGRRLLFVGGGGAAGAVRLQQVRQRVDETQLAVFDAEEVRIRRSAAAGGGAGAEGAERHYGSDRLIHNEVAVGDIDATRYADLTGIVRTSAARMHATLGAVAGGTPGDEIHPGFKERVEVGVGGGLKRGTGVALGSGD